MMWHPARGAGPLDVGLAHADLRIEWRPAPPSTQPPVLVLHGGGPGCHSAADFGILLPHLRHREQILVDLPGYGRSTLLGRLATGPGRFEAFADVLTELVQTLGLQRVDVLAQSLGGSVALALAARRPELVRRVALIGSQPMSAPPGVVSDPQLGARARRAYYESTRGVRELIDCVMSLEWRSVHAIPGWLARRRHVASLTSTALAVAANPNLLPPPEDLAERLPEVQAPCLVVWGAHDPFADVAYAHALAELLPRAEVFAVEGAAHHPQSEKPLETARAVVPHLEPERA